MDTQKIALIVGIFVLLVAGMFAYSYIERQQIEESAQPDETVEEDPQADGPYSSIERIDAKHFFEDGKHTVAGEILMPTPCDLLEWDVSVAESFPEQVTIAFTVLNTADVCAQVLTPQRFMAEFSAGEEASVRATLEGREVELNLIPAAPGESPDDFELFIKG